MKIYENFMRNQIEKLIKEGEGEIRDFNKVETNKF